MEISSKFLGLDRYDLNARLRPALFAGMPIMLIAAVWLPAVWTAMGGLSSILAGCGLTLVLSRVARHRGRRLQDRLKPKAGPYHSMTVLRHADDTIDPQTKARYHAFLRAKGHQVPTKAEEAQDSSAADRLYLGLVTWLLEVTRDPGRFRLLAEENLDYGFRRNLCALKPVAVTILGLCILADAWLGLLHFRGLTSDFWKAAVLDGVLVADLALWCWAVTVAFVTDASKSFATRLLACCDSL